LSACNCIVFKLEQVQDYYQSEAAIAVMNEFKMAAVPLTIGVIPYYSGEDPSIVSTIQQALNNCSRSYTTSPWRIEVAANGYMYEDITDLDLNGQESLLSEAITKIQMVFGVTPKVFIPPYMAFNGVTLSALQAAGFEWLSSYQSQDPPPYIRNSPVWRYPAGSSTNDPVSGAAYSTQQIWSLVETQLSLDGFSVIMMNPQDFGEQAQSGGINVNMIDELRSLLSMAKSSGKRLLLVSEMSQYDNGPVSTASCHKTAVLKREVRDNEVLDSQGNGQIIYAQESLHEDHV